MGGRVREVRGGKERAGRGKGRERKGKEGEGKGVVFVIAVGG